MKIEAEGSIGVKARSVLWYLTFFGFAINYIIRINASIAIVDMIDMNFKKASSSNKTIVTSECVAIINQSLTPELSNEVNLVEARKYVSLERRFLDFLGVEYERDGFKWDAHQQSSVLGSFYWLHWVTQLPGGILAAKYGTKLVFGFSNFFACVMCMIMPIVCYIDYRWMIFLRLVQGFITGLAWPAMHNMTGKWIPPNERSKFVSSYLGSSIGVAISYPMFGFIIKALSWEWVFHSCGIAGTIWYILWLYFVFDSPEDHPRIHTKEREYILQSLGSSVIRKDVKKRAIPWKAMLTSRPVWINTIAQWAGIWGLFTILTQAPTYFRFIHGWGIEMTGILSGLPHILRVVFSLVFSTFGDYLLRSNKMTRNNVRRLATLVSLVFNGFAVLGLAYAGCDVIVAVTFMTLSLCLHGAVATGALASIVDIAPNYAGITLGIVSTVTVIPGFISPIIVGFLTFENQSTTAWQHIFEITAATLIICGLIYIWLNDTAIQDWNKAPAVVTEFPKELKPLFISNSVAEISETKTDTIKEKQ